MLWINNITGKPEKETDFSKRLKDLESYSNYVEWLYENIARLDFSSMSNIDTVVVSSPPTMRLNSVLSQALGASYSRIPITATDEINLPGFVNRNTLLIL